jgi:hypothetical protein
MLYNELAAVGVFTKEESEATFSGAKTKILPPVLERLAKVNQLFGDVDGPKDRRISRDQMLPYGHIAPLHVLFVRYCILNEFYSILTAYLDTYRLATTEDQVNEMIAELNKLFDTPLDQDVTRICSICPSSMPRFGSKYLPTKTNRSPLIPCLPRNHVRRDR